MTHARIDANGCIVARLNGALIPNLEHQADVVPAPQGEAPQGHAWIWSDDAGWETLYIPPQPSAHHVFDYTAKTWVDQRTLADHKAAALRDCGAELTRRLYLPITVGGAPFDADPISRDRITGMILRLQQGRGLPPGWLGWRDADNAMHWSADSAGQVLASLEALSGAIENREQALLITGWTLKAQIEQATTVEEVQAIAWPA